VLSRPPNRRDQDPAGIKEGRLRSGERKNRHDPGKWKPKGFRYGDRRMETWIPVSGGNDSKKGRE